MLTAAWSRSIICFLRNRQSRGILGRSGALGLEGGWAKSFPRPPSLYATGSSSAGEGSGIGGRCGFGDHRKGCAESRCEEFARHAGTHRGDRFGDSGRGSIFARSAGTIEFAAQGGRMKILVHPTNLLSDSIMSLPDLLAFRR